MMAYARKTRDEYDLQGDYGAGWEDLTTETTRREIVARRKEYRENAPGVPYRIRTRRVRLEQPAEACRVCGAPATRGNEHGPLCDDCPGAPDDTPTCEHCHAIIGYEEHGYNCPHRTT